MTITINGTTGIAGVDGSASVPAIKGNDADTGIYYPTANTVAAAAGGASVWNASSTFGYKNRIINGGMTIDQRNAGASVTPTTDAQYGSCDRWSYFISQTSKFSVQQNAGSVTPPVGFTNYLGVTSLSAYTLIGNDNFEVVQKIEGFNASDLNWGTANAQPVTLSFWVRSSLTGTFGGGISNSAYNRSYPFAYTINASNTWEQKTITIPGDTSGTWLTTNGIGLVLQFCLGAVAARTSTAGVWAAGWFPSATGPTSVVSTNGATWFITGVQLEAGPVATSFDFRDFGRELIMCQRYYEKSYNNNLRPGYGEDYGFVYGAGSQGALTSAELLLAYSFKTDKRANPTIVIYDNMGNAGVCSRLQMGAAWHANQTATVPQTRTTGFYISSGSGNPGHACFAHFTASAEL